MQMMSGLTEAQRQRIEENRRKALEKRAAAAKKNQCFLPQPGTSVENRVESQGGTSGKMCQAFHSHNNSHLNYGSHNVPPQTLNNTNTLSSLSGNGGMKPVLSHLLQKSASVPQTVIGANSNSKKSYFKAFDKKCDKQNKGTFVFISGDRFYVDIGYNQKVIEIFKTIPTRMYDANIKKWNFSVNDHDLLVTKLKPLQPEVLFSSLPKHLVKLFSNNAEKTIPQYDLSMLDPHLLNALMPFQKDGVNYAIHHNGRALIADDMGLGKTIQAIAVANYYKKDWPLLVVTPSSVRYSWADAFHTWLPSESHEVAVINSGKEYITKDKIVLMSYDILAKKKDDILRRGFKSMIIDESHFLKNPKSARTKAAQQVMKSMTHIMMLSGTPALSRPIELFPQISALNPKEFTNLLEFGIRYCNGRKMPWGWDFSGSSNMEELQLFLEATVMIRRLKSDVLKQLPPKFRQIVILDPSLIASKNKTLQGFSKKMSKINLKGMERRGVLLEYFHQTGLVKIPAICEYIKDLLEGNKKFLVFAHHQAVLDEICKAVEEEKTDYIRIDGATQSEQRKILCDKFQSSERYRVAVLSITAANAGITLTAAHLVVFAELFWNPGILTQAEDRVHRIGQEDSVLVQYLIAKGTADDEIWPLVQRKLDILNKAGLSKDNFANSSTVNIGDSEQARLESFWSELNTNEDMDNDFNESNFNPCKRSKSS